MADRGEGVKLRAPKSHRVPDAVSVLTVSAGRRSCSSSELAMSHLGSESGRAAGVGGCQQHPVSGLIEAIDFDLAARATLVPAGFGPSWFRRRPISGEHRAKQSLQRRGHQHGSALGGVSDHRTTTLRWPPPYRRPSSCVKRFDGYTPPLGAHASPSSTPASNGSTMGVRNRVQVLGSCGPPV